MRTYWTGGIIPREGAVAVAWRQRKGRRECWRVPGTPVGASVSGGNSEHGLQRGQPERERQPKAQTSQGWQFGPLHREN